MGTKALSQSMICYLPTYMFIFFFLLEESCMKTRITSVFDNVVTCVQYTVDVK